MPVVERQPASDDLRIVVLPFANFSQDPADEHFADGMTEEIISAVSGIRGLTVISRTSAMAYKGVKKSLKEIGRELKVSKALEGSVRKAGNRMRIATQLIDITQDRHLWAQNYDRELGDLFEVQNDIARRIADALRVGIPSRELNRIAKRPTERTEAHSLYLKARQLCSTPVKSSVRKAIQYLELALDQDPEFALAHVGLAECYYQLNGLGYMDDGETAKQARREVFAALQIDEELAEAHVMLARLYEYDWDWDSAEWELNKVAELNPNLPSAHRSYTSLLLIEGRFDEALLEARKALELDPLDPRNNLGVAACYYAMGDYDKMIDYVEKTVEIDPYHSFGRLSLIWAHAGKRDFDRAESAWEKWAALVPETRALEARASLHAVAGEKAKAVQLLDRVLSARDTEGFNPAWLPGIYALLGDEEKMFECLEGLLQEHNSIVADLNWDPDFTKYRSNPRMLAILRRLGLVRQQPQWLEALKRDPRWGSIRARMARPGGREETRQSPRRAEEYGPPRLRGAKDQTKVAFDFLVQAFIEDYMRERLYIEQSGWRSLTHVSHACKIPPGALYGRQGRYGPVLSELLSRGLVESRTFTGQRGRGGNVIKVRITYDRDPTKRYVDRALQL